MARYFRSSLHAEYSWDNLDAGYSENGHPRQIGPPPMTPRGASKMIFKMIFKMILCAGCAARKQTFP
jgi:hypothetical protein